MNLVDTFKNKNNFLKKEIIYESKQKKIFKSFNAYKYLIKNNDLKKVKNKINSYKGGYHYFIENKIYLKKGHVTLQIEFKNSLKKIKLASCSKIKEYIKNNKNKFNVK